MKTHGSPKNHGVIPHGDPFSDVPGKRQRRQADTGLVYHRVLDVGEPVESGGAGNSSVMRYRLMLVTSYVGLLNGL